MRMDHTTAGDSPTKKFWSDWPSKFRELVIFSRAKENPISSLCLYLPLKMFRNKQERQSTRTESFADVC